MTRSTGNPCMGPHAVRLLSCLIGALLAGCASSPAPQRKSESVVARIVANDSGLVPQPLAKYVVADATEGSRNVVLNTMLSAKVAFEMGAFKQSRALLDEAYQRIETIYADNAAAAKARSTFSPESTKDFKGEPYERAMLGYYLGLNDLISGDLDNARSAFKWGEFQDTMSASEVYQGDMASLLFLEAWVDHCRGKRTTSLERFQQAAKARPGLRIPAETDNLLIIYEAGVAPTKVRSGRHGEELSYAPDPNAGIGPVEFDLNGMRLRPSLAEDVHWQATTLGGRQVDKILAGKASFKETATVVSTTGKVFTAVGLEAMQTSSLLGDKNSFNVAGGIAGVGLAMDIFGGIAAAKAKPEADIRAWSNLPGKIFFATAKAPSPEPGKTAEVKALGGRSGGAVLVPVARTGDGNCAIARHSESATERWNRGDPASWVSLSDATKDATPKKGDQPSTSGGERSKVRATF
jgi:hypothetical protein